MGKKVLLADDSITIQKLVEMAFADTDFDLVSVSDGQQAIDKLPEFQPDIVLADAIMPLKDGYEVCRYLKDSQLYAHIPVVLLTGRFQPFDQLKAEQVKIDGRVVKPFVQEQLVDLINRLTSGGEEEPAAEAPVVEEVAEEVGEALEEPVEETPAEYDADETLVLDASMSLDDDQEQDETRADDSMSFDSHSTIRVNPVDLQQFLTDKQIEDGLGQGNDAEELGMDELEDIDDLEDVEELDDALESNEFVAEFEDDEDNSLDQSIEELELDDLAELDEEDEDDVLELDEAQILDDTPIAETPAVEEVEEIDVVAEPVWDEDVEELGDEDFLAEPPEQIALNSIDLEEPSEVEAELDEIDDFELEDVSDEDAFTPIEERDTVSFEDEPMELAEEDLLLDDDFSDVEALSLDDEEPDEAQFDEATVDESGLGQLGIESAAATLPLTLPEDIKEYTLDQPEPEEVDPPEQVIEPIPESADIEPDFEIPTEELDVLGEEDLITEPTDVEATDIPTEVSVIGEDTLPGQNVVTEIEADDTDESLAVTAEPEDEEDEDELDVAEIDDDFLEQVEEVEAVDADAVEPLAFEKALADEGEDVALDLDEEAEPTFDEEFGLDTGDEPVFDAEEMGLETESANETELDMAIADFSLDDDSVEELVAESEVEPLPTASWDEEIITDEVEAEVEFEEPAFEDQPIEEFAELVPDLDDEPFEVETPELPTADLELDIPVEEVPDVDESLGELLDVEVPESEPISVAVAETNETVGSETPPPLPVAMPDNMDELVEAVAKRVIAKLSDEVLREIAWEVIPELAEAMIKSRIHDLEKLAEE